MKLMKEVEERLEREKREEEERQQRDSDQGFSGIQDHPQREPTREEEQNTTLNEYAREIQEAAVEFDIDGPQAGVEGENSYEDQLIQFKLIQKGLENDSLYFVEGKKYDGNNDDDTFLVKELKEEFEE